MPRCPAPTDCIFCRTERLLAPGSALFTMFAQRIPPVPSNASRYASRHTPKNGLLCKGGNHRFENAVRRTCFVVALFSLSAGDPVRILRADGASRGQRERLCRSVAAREPMDQPDARNAEAAREKRDFLLSHVGVYAPLTFITVASAPIEATDASASLTRATNY